ARAGGPSAARTRRAPAAARGGDRLRRRAMALVGCSAGVIARVAGAAVLPARSSVERSAETKAAQLANRAAGSLASAFLKVASTPRGSARFLPEAGGTGS